MVKNNSKYSNRNYKYRSDKNKQSTTTEFKKENCGFCNKQRPARKYRISQSNKLRERNYENFIQLRITIENILVLQFDPEGDVMNLSTKAFNRDVFKLLNKKLNFVAMKKYFSKINSLTKQMFFIEESHLKHI